MSVFQYFACLLNRHQPVRRDVTWNGRTYVGVCEQCDAPIYRVSRRRWRRSEEEYEDEGED